jgi:hypothetical protein
MRRSITIVVSLVAAFASGACEDGPNQTFTAAPTNAANVWNGSPASGGYGDSGIFVAPATQGYDAGVTGQGQNANDTCTAAQRKAIWTDNFTMPIIPNPGLGAGLDLAGGPHGGGIAGYDPNCLTAAKCSPTGSPPVFNYNSATAIEPWTGVTLDQAEVLLCAALTPASPFGASSAQGWAGWGESDEVNVFYNLNSRQLTDIFFFPGYVGNMVGVCTPGTAGVPAGAIGGCTTKTTYTISMYNNVYMTQQVEGQAAENIILDWNTSPNTNKYANLIYEALREVYLPNFPADFDCVAAGHCIIDNNLTSDGILFFTPFNLAIFVANTVATTSVGTSVPLFIDVGVTKILPFSPAQVTLKLDSQGQGPVAYASAAVLGAPATGDCTYSLGMPYGAQGSAGTFEGDCVQPYPPGGTSPSGVSGATLNQVAQAKLVGAIAHSDETYEFDIEGVDPQFTATLSPTTVIADGQLPGSNDVAYQLNIDQFVLGPMANDYTNNDSTQPKDWHGIGLLTLAWAEQVQTYMSANYGVNTDLGDPYCLANFVGGPKAQPLRPGALGGGADAGASGTMGTTTTTPGSSSAGGSSASATSGSGSGTASVGSVGSSTTMATSGTSSGGGPVACTWSAAANSCGPANGNMACQAPAGGACTMTGPNSTGCTCQPKVCSGVEGIVTTAPPALIPPDHPLWAANMIGPAGVSINTISFLTGASIPSCSAAQVQSHDAACNLNGLAVGMKPGTWYALFCSDADGLDKGGFPKNYNNCIGGAINPFNTYQGYYFDTILQAVANSYGHFPNQPPGPLAIPEELASRRFYFQEWMLALVQYLTTAGDPNTPVDTIISNVADPNEFFFDPINGSFESANYIVRNTVNSGNQAPTQLNIATNLQTSVVNNFAFSRHNFRGETALYTALKDVATDLPGAEPLFIQNMVGSPVLSNVFATYACATNAKSPGCNPSQVPPVDPVTGKSIYAPYSDAFGTSAFTIPAFNQPANNSGITVDPGPYELIQSAMVTVPIFTPPYAAMGAKPTGSISELLPYLNGAGVGFQVTYDGSRDKFYNTQNVDFSGATVSASVDFEYTYTPSTTGGAPTQNTTIRAIETGSYLGLTFPCFVVDPSQQYYDVLAIRMYDNADTVLNWIAANPSSVADCGIQIKYSIYGNYADYITFGVYPGLPIAGARYGLNAGYGGSVIADVTIFDPNIVASLGQ